MNRLSRIELLEKATDWLAYIDSQVDQLWHFEFHPPEYYQMFNRMNEYDWHLECFKRHIERSKRIYNSIINQLQTKNF